MFHALNVSSVEKNIIRMKLLLSLIHILMICGTYILQQLYGAMIGAGIYYMTWVLKNKNLF